MSDISGDIANAIFGKLGGAAWTVTKFAFMAGLGHHNRKKDEEMVKKLQEEENKNPEMTDQLKQRGNDK